MDDEHSKNFKKELENIKKKQTELKNIVIVKKHTRRNKQWIIGHRGKISNI